MAKELSIDDLLRFAFKNKASDLHISAGLPPMIRVDGEITKINMPPLDHQKVHSLIYDIMNDKQRADYEEFFETDFSFEIPNVARFRVNAFNQNRGAGGAKQCDGRNEFTVIRQCGADTDGREDRYQPEHCSMPGPISTTSSHNRVFAEGFS